VERRLRDDYERLVTGLAAELTDSSYEHAVEVAALPDLVRGYEGVKLANIEVYRERLRELGVDPGAS